MLSIRYSAVNAKVRYWLSFLLKPQEIELLLNSGFNEVVEYIRSKETKYPIQGEDVTAIEGEVKQAVIEYIKSGSRYITGGAYAFLQEWLRSYEVENLKTVVRSIVGSKRLEFLYHLGQNDRINYESMREIGTLDDLQEFLRPTEYYPLAVRTFPRVREEGNTFFWEMELDNHYARKLKDAADGLRGGERKAVEQLIFYTLEMERLVWMFRVRYHYNMTVEETVALIPNIFKVLSGGRYKTLAASENSGMFLDRLYQWKLIRQPATGIADLERVVNRTIIDLTRRFIQGNPFSLGLFLSFVILKKIQVRTYIILLEGKRNRIDKDSLERMILV